MKALLLIFLALVPIVAQSAKHHPEPGILRDFASFDPEEKLAFLLEMPKGADLDEAISGSVYAESMIPWAAKKGLCLDHSLALSLPPCSNKEPPVKSALSDPDLYQKLLDAWSMRNAEDRAHFREAFGKFELAQQGMTGAMLAEMRSRAARAHVLYMEIAVSPDEHAALALGKRLGWDHHFHNTLENLDNNGLPRLVSSSLEEMKLAESEEDRQLGCGGPNADPGCSVKSSYLYAVSGNAPPGAVFAQLAAGFEIASTKGSNFSGILLDGYEEDSTTDFALQMKMIDFLRSVHPGVHVAVNAGELTTKLVPPEELSFHVNDAVILGHAERIGQGADIMHEAKGLMGTLSAKKILIDICPSRLHTVLGTKQDPLSLYERHGVPVSISGCDAGVLRSELAREYLMTALQNNLGYADLKRMARNSLQYAFMPGKSLWRDATKFIPVNACRRGLSRLKASPNCLKYLKENEKAALQWQLEAEFRDFEKRH